MSIYRIPLPQGIPHFEQQTQLDGITYGLRCHWNEREEAWYFDLLDVDHEPIVCGRKMVASCPLLIRSVDSRLPEGELLVVDLTGENEDPGLNDLDERVILLYFDADAVEALA